MSVTIISNHKIVIIKNWLNLNIVVFHLIRNTYVKIKPKIMP